MSAIRLEALRLLGRRDYTTAELERRLRERGFSADDVRETLSTLTAEGALDDRRVAAAHIRTSTGVKHRGRQRVRLELEARGVDAALVRELLSEVPPETEIAGIETFLRRRRAISPPTLEARERLFQQLRRRGFSAEAIAQALRERGGD